MTHEQAVEWLATQGVRVEVFGVTTIHAAYGKPVPVDPPLEDGTVIGIAPAMATLHRNRDDAGWHTQKPWIIVDHGIFVDAFDDFSNAVVALRDYLVAKERRFRESAPG